MRWIVTLALLVAFAGCTAEPEAIPSEVGPAEPDQPPAGGAGVQETPRPKAQPNATADPESDGPEHNSPPTAMLTVDRTSGVVPATFNLELNGTDPDGDRLRWTLHFDGGIDSLHGTGVPDQAWVRYVEPGNYTITLVVTDGIAAANQTLAVQALPIPTPDEYEANFDVQARAPGGSSSNVAVNGYVILGDGEPREENCVQIGGASQAEAIIISANWTAGGDSKRLRLLLAGDSSYEIEGEAPLEIRLGGRGYQDLVADEDGLFYAWVEGIEGSDWERTVDVTVTVLHFDQDPSASEAGHC